MNPESKLQREILDYLLLRGVMAWRNNAGWLKVGARAIEMAPAGSPDLIGVLPGGRFLGVEVKVPGAGLRLVQEQFHRRLAEHGALVFTVHSLSEARKCVDPYLVTKPAVGGQNMFPGR